MFITNDIKYVGVNDHDIDLFEGQYVVPNGMAYNSYVILDEKIAVMDAVDRRFGEEWLENIRRELDGRSPDYLVVQHMEPDHSANITLFMDSFPEAVVVASQRAFVMMQNFFGTDYADRRLVVGEGDTLTLGRHTLHFVGASMIHWPEVIVSYDDCDKVLFSADAFGKLGALDVEEHWACEARRYYIGIVGKYGAPVQTLLKKVAGLDIQTICPLHGPALKENLGYYINLYDICPPTGWRVRVSSSPIPPSMATPRRPWSCWLRSCAPRAAPRWWSTTWPAATWPRLWRMLSATASWFWPRPPITATSSPL